MNIKSVTNIIKTIISKYKVQTKFIIVGIWNTIFGYGVFLILYAVFLHIFKVRHTSYMSAMILGAFIAIINAFIFHKYITFKSRVRGWRIITEFFKFCMTYVVTFLSSLILLPFFVEILYISPRIAAAIVMIMCAIISYLGHSRFSFYAGVD